VGFQGFELLRLGGDDLVEQALEFGVGEFDSVEGLEFLAKIPF
jgi:hypothetical protein